MMKLRRIAPSLLALLATLAPLTVRAEEFGAPSYAEEATDERIGGRVLSYNGQYQLEVKDSRGFVDRVELHQGTIINPTGLTLRPGMVVNILGYNAGEYFAANEIDTPYTYYNGVPCYQGHPWNYFGTGFALGFFFASTTWWHGGGYAYYPHTGWHDHYWYHNNWHGTYFHRPGGEWHNESWNAGGWNHGNIQHGNWDHGNFQHGDWHHGAGYRGVTSESRHVGDGHWSHHEGGGHEGGSAQHGELHHEH